MPVVSPDDNLVTVQQAASLLGVSVRTVERLQSDGELVPVYLPTTGRARLRRFRRTDLDRRIQRATIRASA